MEKPLFNWLDQRSAGVLLHPTSLPNQYAIGNFGPSAKSFVDLIVSCGFKFWQMLPLGPTGYGDSPYQSYSSHAINPLLLDWDSLISQGWVKTQDLSLLRQQNIERIDFDAIKTVHEKLRRIVVKAGLNDSEATSRYDAFLKSQSSWVQDYALFMALKKFNKNLPWNQWKKAHRDYAQAKSLKQSEVIKAEIDHICFEQFILLEQWNTLKKYANDQNVQIIGDIPIYVSPDSVDVWANREVFQVTKTGKFSNLAGVPPDYFNEDGQFWGNPLYNWKHLKLTDYDWWIDRLNHTLSLFDVLRFDHFRALAAYWAIPSCASSAKEGKWVKGPGLDFFEVIQKRLPNAKLILEDLGEITPDVIKLRNRTGCPGLAVLQFAFGGSSDNFYLPHNLIHNSVVYTGTHDNDTSLGWYQSASEKEQDHLRRYLNISGNEAAWDLIRTAYASIANLCIIPVQDLLSLDSRARMNTPGEATGNWDWRMDHQQMFDLGRNSADYLRSLAELYRRNS